MSIFRKTTAFLLTAAMLLALAACGENTQQTTASPVPADTPAAEAPATAAPAETPTEVPSQGTLPRAQAADLLEGYTARPVEDRPADDDFIRAGFQWSADLFRQVYRRETEQKTLLISPLSAVTALAMTANGAGGNTRQELEQVLGSGTLSLDDLNAYLHTFLNSLPSSESARFGFADGIWFKEEEGFIVKADFLQKNTDHFDAAIRKAPFDDSTLREINQWVALHTDDMIPKLLERLSPDTVMVLINALVFDAKWEIPFQEEGETLHPFTGLDGRETQTAVMFGEEFSYLEDETCTGFTKSYADDTYRFVALLPKDGTDFAGFIDGLTGERLAALTANAAAERTLIMLPKFSYDYRISLPDVLKAMGLHDCFDGSRADFSGISDTPLYIGDVLHKTHIDLDSEGTRAAAATAVIMDKSVSLHTDEPHKVWLDRPFVYMIVDTATGLPVFMGTVTGFSE